MREVFAIARRAAGSSATILILGETGTGKDVMARAIHQHSSRAAGPFVIFDCAATPANLIESALFGHIKGSFTGAVADHVGKFEQADGGTLFLDEIGDMPPTLQSTAQVASAFVRSRTDSHALARASLSLVLCSAATSAAASSLPFIGCASGCGSASARHALAAVGRQQPSVLLALGVTGVDTDTLLIMPAAPPEALRPPAGPWPRRPPPGAP